MKKMMMIALVMMVSAVAFAKPGAPVKVVSKTMDVVYFKVSRDMIGATMEVYDAKHNLLHAAKVVDKKVIVDFYAEPSGVYTIHLEKNGNDQSIEFAKASESHTASRNHITVTQM